MTTTILCGLSQACGHCLRLIGLSHLPDFIKHLNQISMHSVKSEKERETEKETKKERERARQREKGRECRETQASSGQLIAYKYCDSRPEAVIKLLGRSVDQPIGRSIGCPDQAKVNLHMDNAKPSDPTVPNYRTIVPLCKSNADCGNLLSQLAGLLRISTVETVRPGRTHPEAAVVGAVLWRLFMFQSAPRRNGRAFSIPTR